MKNEKTTVRDCIRVASFELHGTDVEALRAYMADNGIDRTTTAIRQLVRRALRKCLTEVTEVSSERYDMPGV